MSRVTGRRRGCSISVTTPHIISHSSLITESSANCSLVVSKQGEMQQWLNDKTVGGLILMGELRNNRYALKGGEDGTETKFEIKTENARNPSRSGSIYRERNRINAFSVCDSSSELRRGWNVTDLKCWGEFGAQSGLFIEAITKVNGMFGFIASELE